MASLQEGMAVLLVSNIIATIFKAHRFERFWMIEATSTVTLLGAVRDVPRSP